MKLISLIFPLFFTILPLWGQGFWGNVFPEPRIEYSPKTYVCHKAETSILVDGKLNELPPLKLPESCVTPLAQ